MNASNGSLVGSIATDDPDFGARIAEQTMAFKVGINKPRSRGDREEVFGGHGRLLEGRVRRRRPAGAGRHHGPGGPDEERLHGNFPGYSSYPGRF